MSKKSEECVNKLRHLVSGVQGAPYPAVIENELYTIWYEHIQSTAMDCFEFLNLHWPEEAENISKTLDKEL